MFHFKSIKTKGFTRLSQLILICGGLVLLAPATSIAAVTCSVMRIEHLSSTLRLSPKTPLHTVFKTLQSKISLHCSGIEINQGLRLSNNISSSTRPDSSGIYSISPKGIGVRYTLNAGSTCSQVGPSINNKSIICHTNVGDPSLIVDLIYDMEFIKLDNNHGVGSISGVPSFKINYWNYNSISTITDVFFPQNDINISRSSCTISIPDINFDLGKQQQKDFTRIGPIGREQTQKIALTCDPNTKYSLQVNGDAEPGHPGVIKLTPGAGAATGVGVQLHANGQPVKFNEATEMGHTAASGTDIQEEIDITARYYQTAPTITPGKANASATYTMTYQ